MRQEWLFRIWIGVNHGIERADRLDLSITLVIPQAKYKWKLFFHDLSHSFPIPTQSYTIEILADYTRDMQTLQFICPISAYVLCKRTFVLWFGLECVQWKHAVSLGGGSENMLFALHGTNVSNHRLGKRCVGRDESAFPQSPSPLRRTRWEHTFPALWNVRPKYSPQFCYDLFYRMRKWTPGRGYHVDHSDKGKE